MTKPRALSVDLDLRFDSDVLHVLDELSGLLARRAPSWSARVRVEDEQADLRAPEALQMAVRQEFEAQARRRPAVASQMRERASQVSLTPGGTVEVRGANRSLVVIVRGYTGGDAVNYIENNKVGIQVRAARVDGVEAIEWTRAIFREACDLLSPAYAKGYLTEEFDSKNVIDDDQGVRAIGVDLRAGIPGLYWLNGFGWRYQKLLGKERLLSAPSSVALVNTTALLMLAEDGRAWKTEEYRSRESAVREHLGSRFFFNRESRESELVSFVSEGLAEHEA